ncbi:MAG: Phosphatidylglycerophosphatase A [Methanobacterium sp. PtaU1.Bin242]|nr:MAG: Phosphatidylglycerophosphatase A [Methanobacterium sp. PtaU1.Bin242]
METKICLNDTLLKIDHETIIIQRENGFLSIGTPTIGGGIRNIKSIINHGLYSSSEYSNNVIAAKKILSKLIKDNNILEPVAGILGCFNVKNMVNITMGGVTTIITADNQNLSMNLIVILNDYLDNETLLKLFKTVSDTKFAAYWDTGVSFDTQVSGEDNILVACAGYGDAKTKKEADNIRKSVEQCVKKATMQALRNCGFPRDVLGFMEDAGVKVEDLVEAGMQLCVGVEKSDALNIKLHNQILKSLEDLNVVSLIIAGIRLEEDYAKHRVRGVNVDDDPAYLYSDEVLGMAVANQIAGTKAIFNFKRYDEAKPGIIGTLGPVLDDIFAGLVAGCMSKIFEA